MRGAGDIVSTNTVILVLPGTFLENVRFSYVSHHMEFGEFTHGNH